MKQLPIVTALLLAFAASPALGEGSRKASTQLSGAQEVPFVSTPGNARFRAEINRAGTAIDWSVSYSDMQADVTQAHIHIGQFRVNGGIVLWICRTTQTNAPASTAMCPGLREGNLTGTWTAADVVTVAAQGFETGNLAEVIAAIRAGAAYANIHTVQSPTGEIRGQLRASHHGHDDDDDD
jgi:hypothetical protein